MCHKYHNGEMFFKVSGSVSPSDFSEALSGILSTFVGRDRATALLDDVASFDDVFPTKADAEDFLFDYSGDSPVCAVRFGSGDNLLWLVQVVDAAA